MDGQHRDGTDSVDVVVMVTSAGGLEALITVLRELPEDLPAAVVAQQHLGGQGSQVVKILRRRTGHAVEWVADGQHLERGRVLLAPARRRLEVLPDGSCAVDPASLDFRDRPHDMLLTSLAHSYGSRVLAVVLTGMGNDGAAGVRALKDAGALVIAQSEDTAEQPSMPRAAVEAGAHLVLPLHQIAAVVADVVRGAPLPRGNGELEAIQATFGDQGQVAAAAREIDWSGHPLGPVHGWSPVLRSVLALAAAYPTPFTVFWGEDLIHFYNDAAAQTHGAKHPGIFALPAREAFPDLVELVEGMWQVVRGGQTLHLPGMLVPMVRGEQLQDVWFDFVHAPIRDADGTITGVGSVWYERTEQVLGARRLDTLNRLAGAPAVPGREGALKAALGVLEEGADVPFAAVYQIDAAGARAALAHAVGVPVASALAPQTLGLTPSSPWPLQQVLEAGRQVLLEDLPARFRGHLVGAQRLAPRVAVLHPLRDEARERVVGVLVLGANPRLCFDDRYREFLTLVGETVSGKVAEAHARQREHERLEGLAELDRAKTEFFSNVSHEFRTPLTLLLAPLEEALRRADELPGDIAAELALAQRNARRLLRLVGTLLDFSQIEAGRLRAAFVPTDLGALPARSRPCSAVPPRPPGSHSRSTPTLCRSRCGWTRTCGRRSSPTWCPTR